MNVQRWALITCVFLAFSVSVLALNESDIGTFRPEEGIKPPLLPEEDKDTITIEFILEKANGEPVENVHAILSLKNDITGNTAGNLQFTQEGKVNMKVKPGRLVGTLGVDEATTLGSDYFSNIDLRVEQDTTITPSLIKVGNILGEVYDDKNRVVSNARISLECKQYIQTETKSDEFGIFFAEYLAPGRCKIAGMSEKNIGFATVDVEAGKVIDTKIVLDKEIAGSKNVMALFLIAAVVAILIVLYFKVRSKVLTEEPSKTKQKTLQVQKRGKKRQKTAKVDYNSTRVNDVLKTLKERERAVVEFLLQNNFASTQAKIKNGTSIPKTSLMRVFDALAARNIVEVQKHGKAKKIKLTEWLLGKK